jgi:hypothetical protein
MRKWGALHAAFDMPAQRCGSAALDRRHDLELAEAHTLAKIILFSSTE